MEELKTIMLAAGEVTGEKMTLDEILEMFKEIDSNADGSLSIAEIGKYITGRSF